MEKHYIFNAPIYTEPSSRFRNFIKTVGHSTTTSSVIATYWKSHLSFCSQIGDKSIKSSVIPTSENLSKAKTEKAQKEISRFASKLNGAMSMAGKDCSILIDLVKPSADDMSLYSKDVRCIIRVTVICKTLAKQMALENFITVVDNNLVV